MSTEAPNILILCDSNAANFASAIRKQIGGAHVVEIPYGQLQQVLADTSHEIWNYDYDLVVTWMDVHAIAPHFPHAVSIEETGRFIDAYSSIYSLSTRFIFIEPATDASFYGFTRQDEHEMLQRINLVLREKLQLLSTTVISPLPFLLKAGEKAFSPKLWYLSKTRFHASVYQEAAKTIASFWKGWNGASKKLVIVDLDDTVWGGIVGDDGWENLRLGGHDGEGEALADFQRGLLDLKDRGVLLGIASKNEEAVAVEAFEKHPEMVVKMTDFAAWRINWQDKATNISEIAEELNLGLDSVVFLDDNPVERDRIRTALPMVTVPELPADKLLYPSFLAALDIFNAPALTEEDKRRAEMYNEERLRKQELVTFQSPDAWLASLGMVVEIRELSRENLQRATQLLNKTNQMNLSTRRLSDEALWTWAEQEGATLWTVHVRDKFGNAGLTGLISMYTIDHRAMIQDFLLSCRVMGRKVEETMLAFLFSAAASRGADTIEAMLIPTEKNNPCMAFFDRSVMKKEGNVYISQTASGQEYPEFITLSII